MPNQKPGVWSNSLKRSKTNQNKLKKFFFFVSNIEIGKRVRRAEWINFPRFTSPFKVQIATQEMHITTDRKFPLISDCALVVVFT